MAIIFKMTRLLKLTKFSCGLLGGLSTVAMAENFKVNIVTADGQVVQKSFDAQALLARPALLEKMMIKLLNTYSVDELKVLYPLYQQLKKQDPIVNLWANAIFANIKNPNLAIQNYQQLLKLHPNIYPAKLQLAILLLRTQRPELAKPLLQEITKDTPEIYQSIAQNYLDFLTPISKWEYDFGVSYVQDNNINGVAKTGTQHNALISTAKPIKVRGVSYGASVGRNFHFGNYFTGINVDVSGKYYDKHEHDELDLYLQPSFGIDTRYLQYGISPFYHPSFYGGGDPKDRKLRLFYQGVGASIFAHYYPLNFIKLSPRLTYEKRFYQNFDNNQTITSALNVAFLQKQYRIDFGIQLKNRFAKIQSSSYNQWRFRLGTSAYLDNGLGLNFTSFYTPRYYKAALFRHSIVDFYNIPRKDKEWQFDLSFWHNKIQFLGIIPRITFEYKRFRSTNVFKNHNKKQIFFSFNKNF